MKRRRTKRKASDGETKQVKKRFEVGEEAICETPEIGKDLMFEVLTRLPIKSLLRFKAVSKYWFRLISCSEFIKFRLRNACEDPDLSDHRVVYIKRSDSEVALRQIPLHPLVCANGAYFMFEINVSHPMEINASHPMEFWEEEARRFALTFVGSCSGLVCIAGLNHRLIVWNPALRKCKRLPYFGRGSPVSYGFGYDEASDDFKVVGIRNTPKTLVKIYSARTNSWKKLQEDDFVVDRVEGRGCLLNGKLHWATKKDMIFTVDLSSERFGAMEPPDCVRGRDCTGWSVHAAGTSLAVFCFHRNRPPMMYVADLWMMDQYGVKESWTRVNNDITDRRHMGWAVFKERAVLLHSLYVAPSRPREVWQLIPAPGHMTDNDIIAFLLHSVKQYSFYDPPYFFMAFGIGQEYPVTVYVESLTWPFL